MSGGSSDCQETVRIAPKRGLASRFSIPRGYTARMSPRRSKSKDNSQRPLLIVALLLFCLILIAALGWQYWRLQQSNTEAAATVLRDNGMQVADEFSQRLTKSVSYFGYTAIFKRCGREPDDVLAAISTDAAGLTKSVFWHDGTRLSIGGAAVSADLEALIIKLQRSAPDTEAWIRPAHIDTTSERIVYNLFTLNLCGFVLNVAGISSFAQRSIDDGPLLPASAAGRLVGNDSFYIEVLDWLGESVFKVNAQFDSRLSVSRPLTEDPQDVLAGFIVRVSLDPRTESVLVVGGLPQSRLRWLTVILAMAILLLVGAIWLFRREQAVMEMREDFVSQVSHELRTPLTQIRMFAETLLLNRTRSDDERRRSLEIIDRESQRLSHLVDNVLRASKVSDTVQLDCYEQPLAPILREVCNSMQSATDRVTIQLSVDKSVVANADADAFREIVLNLLDNAIKYGPDGQTISVVLGDVEGNVRLSVEDQGPGIPEIETERVWGKFYRLGRERTSAIGGTGIGLAVVRELTEAMGGRCWFDSSNGGARVNVEFPGDKDRD